MTSFSRICKNLQTIERNLLDRSIPRARKIAQVVGILVCASFGAKAMVQTANAIAAFVNPAIFWSFFFSSALAVLAYDLAYIGWNVYQIGTDGVAGEASFTLLGDKILQDTIIFGSSWAILRMTVLQPDRTNWTLGNLCRRVVSLLVQ